MENTPIKLENILEQAPNWTFAGDFTLLQWMNKISQDLESRATNTTEALSKLNNNVRSTNIALDNVANSLTTLQFGNQFVECRVQDDDETLPNVNEATSDGYNDTEELPSSKEMLKTFLDNNLKILRNCHEKYSLDLDDSDDDDDEGGSSEKTCIYQPINPYNERPLPYIFGSKDWHAKWHVGLYENQQDNSYSGDEISETFSESSSNSPTDDNESFESNTEWASSNSIDNDNYNANIEVRNASSLRGSQALFPGTPNVPIKGSKTHTTISESSSLSTPSSTSMAQQHAKRQKHTEIKSRSESINSINSKMSNKNEQQSLAKEKPSAYKTQAPPYVDLFAEPPEDIESSTTTSSSQTSGQITKRSSIDYANTLTTQTKSVSVDRPSLFRTQPPPFVDLFAAPPEDIQPPSSTTSSSTNSSNKNIKRKPVNLFDDDAGQEYLDGLLTIQTKKVELDKSQNREEKSMQDNDIYEDDLLPHHLREDMVEKTKTKADSSINSNTQNKVLNVPKSLFEDDDEDDDFLSAFIKKSTTKDVPKSSLTKKLLFDNDVEKERNTNLYQQDAVGTEPGKDKIQTSIAKSTKTNKVNLFDDLEEDDEDENDLFSNVNKNISGNKQNINIFKESKELDKEKEQNKPDTKIEAIRTNQSKEDIERAINVFDDLEENLEREDIKQKSDINKDKKIENESDSIRNNKSKEIRKPINIFEDFKENLDGKDVKQKSEIDKMDSFAAKESKAEPIIHSNENIKQTIHVFDDLEEKSETKKLTNKKINLFDDFDEEDDDDIFAVKTKRNLKSEEDKTTSKQLNTNENINEISSHDQESLKTSSKSLFEKQESLENLTKSENLIKEEEKVPSKKDITNAPILEGNTIESKETITDYDKGQGDTSKNATESLTKQQETTKIKTKSTDEINQDRNENFKENELSKTINNNSKKPQVLSSKPTKVVPKEKTIEKTLQASNREELNNKSTSPENFIPKTTLQNEQSSEDSQITNDEIPSIVKDVEPPLASSSANKYDFNSIMFLDEPPEDDSEFFETLTKTPSTLNTNYNSIDLENDLYEPELPKVPSNNQMESAENRQTALYTGLQLFSDIPPDDDDDAAPDNNPSFGSTAVGSTVSKPTKRLHSVFYDDFNETLMALNKNQQDITATSSIYHDVQPPPLKEEEKMTNKDVVDHKISTVKPGIVAVENSALKTSAKRPVSKLQMPNININVQALLPGANTTLRKAKEESKKLPGEETEKDTLIKQPTAIVQSNKKEIVVSSEKETVVAPKKETVTIPRTTETEHILPNVTKDRVRAPAMRRPSTRKARQDNYRKSLMEQEPEFSEAINKKESDVVSPLKPSIVEDLKIKTLVQDDKEDIFKKVKFPIKSNTSKSTGDEDIIKKASKDQSINKSELKGPDTSTLFKHKSSSRSSSILFDDDDGEDDDDFFKNIKTSTIKSKTVTTDQVLQEKSDHSKVYGKDENRTVSLLGEEQMKYDGKYITVNPEKKVLQSDSSKTNVTPPKDSTNTNLEEQTKSVKSSAKSSPSFPGDEKEKLNIEQEQTKSVENLSSCPGDEKQKQEQTKSSASFLEIEKQKLDPKQEPKKSAKSSDSFLKDKNQKLDSKQEPTKSIKSSDHFRQDEKLKLDSNEDPTKSFQSSANFLQDENPNLDSKQKSTKSLKSSTSFLDDENDDNDDNLFGTSIVKQKQDTKIKETKSVESSASFLENEKQNRDSKQEPTKFVKSSDSFIQDQKLNLDSKQEPTKSIKSSTSFLDNESDENDDNLFGTSIVKQKQDSKIEQTKSVKISDEKQKVDSKQQPIKPVKSPHSFLQDENLNFDSKQESTKSVKSSTSFLDEENDDNLFRSPVASGSKSQNKSKSHNINSFFATKNDIINDSLTKAMKKQKNLDAKAKFRSFLDNDSDDDDFSVAGLQATKSRQSSNASTPPTQLSNTIKDNEKDKIIVAGLQTSTQQQSSAKVAKPPSTVTASKSSSSKLFTDSDTDSEDLFGKSSSNKTIQKPLNKSKVLDRAQVETTAKVYTAKPQTSLFGDDSDGDDNFLSSTASASKKSIPKSSVKESKSKLVPQPNTSIFSDIESDEDDLFGGGAQKPVTSAPAIQTVKASVAPQSVPTKTPTNTKPQTIADNPLADLL